MSTLNTSLTDAWRDGERLVLHERKAVLPQRCIVCDAPDDVAPVKIRLQETVSTTAFVFAGIYAFVFARRARVKLWVCPRHRQTEIRCRRIFRSMFIPGLILAFIPGLILCGVFLIGGDPSPDMIEHPLFPWLGLFSLPWPFLLLGAAIFAMLRPRLVRAARIDKPFVWLDNVHPDYLARFPELPPPE